MFFMFKFYVTMLTGKTTNLSIIERDSEDFMQVYNAAWKRALNFALMQDGVVERIEFIIAEPYKEEV